MLTSARTVRPEPSTDGLEAAGSRRVAVPLLGYLWLVSAADATGSVLLGNGVAWLAAVVLAAGWSFA
jgi:hypothetical protein